MRCSLHFLFLGLVFFSLFTFYISDAENPGGYNGKSLGFLKNADRADLGTTGLLPRTEKLGNLSNSRFPLGVVSHLVDCQSRTIWIVDAHRDDGKLFVVRAEDAT